jgi:hypothetical protein
VLLATRRPGFEPCASLAVPLGLVAVSPVLCGHAGDGIFAPVEIVHVVAVSAWLGGPVALLVALRATRAEAAAGAAVLPFRAPVRVAALATGAGQTLARLPAVSALGDTAYGRLILVKLTLFTALLVFGARNRCVLQPRLVSGGAAPCSAARSDGSSGSRSPRSRRPACSREPRRRAEPDVGSRTRNALATCRRRARNPGAPPWRPCFDRCAGRLTGPPIRRAWMASGGDP